MKIDFAGREICLLFYALFGTDDQPVAERYKKCKLILREYAIAAIETATAYREITDPRGLGITRTELSDKDKQSISEAGYAIPGNNFWLSLFVYAWNSRIIVNAHDATLEFL